MFQLIKKIALVAACVVSFGAQAGSIEDTVNVNQGTSGLEFVSWTHDLNDTGFVLGSAQSATLTIDFFNDIKFLDFLDTATIQIGNLDFQDGGFVYKPSSSWASEIGVASLEFLNNAGKLTVKVLTTGLFYIGDSTLNVTTADAVSVPESSSLMLFALGLFGLVALRKRKAA